MSTALKAYIAGVVIIGALALLIATLVYPPESTIAIKIPFGAANQGLSIVAGVGFWILLTLVSWALPVKLPFGTQQGVSPAPIRAAIFLGGRAGGAWVAGPGTAPQHRGQHASDRLPSGRFRCPTTTGTLPERPVSTRRGVEPRPPRVATYPPLTPPNHLPLR